MTIAFTEKFSALRHNFIWFCRAVSSVVVAGLFACALGQTGTGRITGAITFEDGTRTATCIFLDQPVSNPAATTTTYATKQVVTKDADEPSFEIDVAPGLYRVRVMAFGFEEFISEPFQIESGQGKAIRPQLKVDLHRFIHPGLYRVEDETITSKRKSVRRLVQFTTLFRTDYSGIQTVGRFVITSSKEWETFWSQIRYSSPPPMPKIDFEKRMVIVNAVGKRNTGGFSTEMIRLVETEDSLNVWIKDDFPGEVVTMAFTQPLHVIETEKNVKKILFSGPQYLPPCR